MHYAQARVVFRRHAFGCVLRCNESCVQHGEIYRERDIEYNDLVTCSLRYGSSFSDASTNHHTHTRWEDTLRWFQFT